MTAGPLGGGGGRVGLEQRAGPITTWPMVETILGGDPIHARRVAEQIGLKRGTRIGAWVVGAERCRISRGPECVRIRRADGPVLADRLRRAGEDAVARALVEFRGGVFPPQPL